MKDRAQHIVAIRRLEWDAMHRIPGHEGKCGAFHGHRYAVEIAVEAPTLDTLGRVVDFSVIKGAVGQWIDEHFDHTAILYKADPAAELIARYNADAGKQVYLLEQMPTAENIALELAKIAYDLLRPHNIRVVSLRVWETPNCSALWSSSE